MKLLIALAFLAVAAAYESSVKVSESWEDLVFGGIRPPGYGITNMDEVRIIGGSNASPGQYPYQVSLQVVQGSSRYHTCGGSILSTSKIACAAHCCVGQNVGNLRVVAGAHNMQVTESSQQVSSVSRLTVHPSYNGNTINNDACKIFLSTPLQLNARVATIPLCTSEPTSGNCVATGWGTTSTGGTVVPTQLQTVSLAIIPRQTCASNYAGVNTITTAMLCAGGTAGRGGCNGDSGGPLNCGGCLAGATSWGMQPCAQQRYPTVYANVANLASFYNSN